MGLRRNAFYHGGTYYPEGCDRCAMFRTSCWRVDQANELDRQLADSWAYWVAQGRVKREAPAPEPKSPATR